ncbi:MAG: hypothetical protein M3151_04460 [Actinomycetota bacterium]|nr:hypothetical protein [Actinomycetota bacterium]
MFPCSHHGVLGGVTRGTGQGQRRDGVFLLAPYPQGCPAGGKHDDLGAGLDEDGHLCGCF